MTKVVVILCPEEKVSDGGRRLDVLLTNGIESPELGVKVVIDSGVDVMVLFVDITGMPEIDVLETDVPEIAVIEAGIVALVDGKGGAELDEVEFKELELE